MSRYTNTSTVIVISTLLLLFITPTVAISGTNEKASAYNAQYSFFSQKLFVSVQPSLYAYYNNMTHALTNDSNYSKLITPQAVQTIAESILQITRNMPYSDEQFANAVLAIVHQIPYNITGAKYPVETLVDNYGDCGSLSLLAASIMKAGGLDVVLIKYTGIDPQHMNVGVYLPYIPIYHNLLMSTTSFNYNNKTYWTAEATPQGDWKVGDQSYKMANANPVIIPLDRSEQSSPGQVSSSLATPLSWSSITINLSPQPSSAQENKRVLVISGSIQPANPNSRITIFINKNGFHTSYFNTVADNMSRYAFIWNFTSTGTYYITTSWSGNATNASADSETLVVFIGPEALKQFQTDSYNYVIGAGVIADIAVRPFIGVNDFLSIQLGTNISLSYNFIVLQTGHTASDIQTDNITIPSSEYIIRLRNRQTKIVEIPARTIIVPTNVPRGLEPLRLPDDFNQTINSKFCFIVQNNLNSSYSLNIKALTDYDITNIKQDNESSTAFLNATQGIKEGAWYKVTTTISENGITANLQREDGTSIESMSAPYNLKSGTQLVLLIANNVDSAVVLKDSKIQAMNNASQPPENTKQTPATQTYRFYILTQWYS
jgi:hypothetical protein